MRNVGRTIEWIPSGRLIGWTNGSDVYLDPGAAYTIAMEIAQKQGTTVPFKESTLWERLKNKNLLISNEKDRNKERITICGERKTIVHLVPGCLEEVTEDNKILIEDAGLSKMEPDKGILC